MDSGKIFVSYQRSDLEFVQRLVRGLEGAGLAVWFDQRVDDTSAQERIDQHLRSCRYVLVVLSASYTSSTWIAYELNRAKELKKKILVLRLPGGSKPSELADRPSYEVMPHGGDSDSLDQAADASLGWILSVLMASVFQPLARAVHALGQIRHPFLQHVACRILLDAATEIETMRDAIQTLAHPSESFASESEWAIRLQEHLEGENTQRVEAVCGDKRHHVPEIKGYEAQNLAAAQRRVSIQRVFVASHQESEGSFSADRSAFIRQHTFDNGPADTPRRLQGRVILGRPLEVMASFGVSPDVGFAILHSDKPLAVVHVKPNGGLAAPAWAFHHPRTLTELEKIWNGLWLMGTADWRLVRDRLAHSKGVPSTDSEQDGTTAAGEPGAP